jgi:prevent-host-death family protein
MSKKWQLQEAKNRFSEVVEKAMSEGPQIVTKRGEDAVVVLSMKDFKKSTQKKMSLLEFLQNSPLKGSDLVIERSRDTGRNIKL